MKHGFAHMRVFEDWWVEHKEKYNMSKTFWSFQNMESCKNHSPMEPGIKGKKSNISLSLNHLRWFAWFGSLPFPSLYHTHIQTPTAPKNPKP
ncbi:hypothetical protein VNO80_14217 [Phaseolus coccineus]|uniref:Uncharacterized protein n=1 Tax=Phaseolus coccineus TaxID=3886 RepID=A0AAN9MIB4_PHACN